MIAGILVFFERSAFDLRIDCSTWADIFSFIPPTNASSLRCQRVFGDRLNPLDEYSGGEFIARYRITRYIFTELLDEISSKLFRSTTRSHSIPPTTQLAVALQFLATGTFQTVVSSGHGISQTPVSRCVTAVCDGLSSIASRYIQFPSISRQRVIQKSFLQHGGFPLAFGCIDGSHVYVNRKLFHSINIKQFVITSFVS